METFTHYLFGEKFNIGKELNEELAKKYFNRKVLEEKSREFENTPIDRIFYILQETAVKICDREGIYFKRIMDELPKALNYSSEMVETALDMLPDILSVKTLKERLKPLGDYKILDNFVKEDYTKKVVPIGSVLHVCAGNIFLGSIDSLVLGLITKNINVLKVSSDDLIFPIIFYEALKEADEDNIITDYISITYWNHDNKSIDNIVKENFDGILLFGGEDAVISYKDGLSYRSELYAFGPKISFGVVSKNLNINELREAAKGFSTDIVFWEQRACTSCQNIFIEEDENTDKFIKFLFEALEEKAIEFPQNNLDINSSVEIRKERELGKWVEFKGDGKVLEGKNGSHTIIVSSSNNLKTSPLNRTIYVNKIRSYKELEKSNLRELSYYMSTAAIAFKGIQSVVDDLVKIGVKRFCKPGTMSTAGDAEKPHDGLYLPYLLVRFINIEDLDSSKLGIEYLNEEDKDKMILWKLNNLIYKSLESPFYKEIYKDIKLPINTLEEFKKIPILTKDNIYENGIDSGNNMVTDKLSNAYIFSAGGTTGKMKYVAYSNEEFKKSKKVFGSGFKALGINENDVVANYMKSGALWTAFSAVNDGLEETGCRILSLTANQPEKETIEYLKIFKPNVIMGLPGNLILLAQEVNKIKENIKFEKIYYGGEHLSDKAREYIKKTFKSEIIASLGYAAVEIGPIGFQCPYCKDKEFHVCDEWAYLECSEDGEALVTALERNLNPIIKYKLGDKIEVLENKCACGRTSKKFKLLGRSDDVIRFNVSDLHLSEVYESLKHVNGASSNFQIKVDNLNENRALTFRVEKEDYSHIDAVKLKGKILSSLMDRCKCICEDKKLNLLEKIDVEVIEPNSIKRVGRTGKLKRIVDNRI